MVSRSGGQRRAPVVLPGQRIRADRAGQRAGDADLKACIHGEQTGVEGHVVAGAGGQAVAEIQALGGRAVLPRLDMPGHEHAPSTERSRVQPAEHAPSAAVGQHVQGEHTLPDPSRGQQDALGLLLGPGTFGRGLGNLVLEGILQSRGAEVVLAEEVEFAVVLKSEEIRQAVGANALARTAVISTR
jgi:hypothetical protein